MAIKDLLKPVDQAQLMARLEADVINAKNRLDASASAWADALADEAEGIGDAGRTGRAEQERDQAGRAHEAACVALDTARRRAKAQALKSQSDALARQWAEAVKLAEKRQTAVEALAEAAEVYAAAHAALLAVNDELLAALPEKPDWDAARLRPQQLEGAAKVDLARLGVSWAINFVTFGRLAAPSLRDSFMGTVDLIKAWGGRAMKRS